MMSGNLNRRRFLRLSAFGAAAATVGGAAGAVSGLWLPPRADARIAAAQSGTGTGRTLVVVDLQGGNDALNTFVPVDAGQYGQYRDMRPAIALEEDDLIAFDGMDEYGAHPALAALAPMWNAGQVAALYGTGLPGQGRSHFVAQDAWRTAQPGEPARSGWLGRWLETSADEKVSDLRAVALGQSTLAAQGAEGRPVAIQSVEGFRLNPAGGDDAVTAAVLAMGEPLLDGWFGEAQSAIPRAVDAVAELEGLLSGIELREGEEIDLDGDQALFHAAQAIIQGEVGAEVLYLTINGFDTHALQPAKQDALLQLVADGLADLFAALERSGHAENTVAMVVSEFGRRVAENGSTGTDHGRGGLSFVLGPSVADGGLIGGIDLDDLVEGDLPITIDARTMYDSALTWLGASGDTVTDVLGARYDDIALL